MLLEHGLRRTARHAGAPQLWAAVWGAAAAWLAVRLAGEAPDDMFITFRYAWNLAHGEGFVFNPGERVFGLTNPGQGLLLAGLHAVTRVPVHLLAGWVFGGALWALAVLVHRELRARGAGAVAVVGGSLVVASTAIWLNLGAAGPSTLALLAAAAALAPRRPGLSGVVAGLAAWFRPDAVLGVAALGALLTLRERRIPVRWGVGAAGVLVVGAAAAWLWFGSVVPQTLVAKRAFADVLAAGREARGSAARGFWESSWTLLRVHLGDGVLLVVAIGIAGLWPLFVGGGLAVRTVVLYAAGVAVGYPLLRVSFHHWYAIPCVAVLAYGVAAFAVGAGRALGRALAAAKAPAWRHRLGAATAAALLLAPVVASIGEVSAGWLGRSHGGGRFDAYREAALWIRESSRPGERIAFGEIGNLAYWSRRPVDDLLALVTPQTMPYVREGDLPGAFLAVAPTFYLHRPGGPHPGIAQHRWFRKAYAPVARFEERRGRRTVTVFRRRPGAELPPPRPPIPWRVASDVR